MEDYKSAHLAWIKETKTFTPKNAHEFTESYYDIMKEVYSNPTCSQEHAEWFYMSDKLWHKKSRSLSKSIDKKIERLEPTPNGWWFITIGFNHETWSVSDCDKCIRKILDMEWIVRGKANFELHRTNGQHPHCHFLIETKEPKSRILDKLYRPLYTKKVVFSKNFIDVKPMMEYHHKYINLDKVEEKMESVKKDIEWRIKEKIPDYEKNWDSCQYRR